MNRYGLTKTEMLNDLNTVLNNFYGCNTTVAKKIERLPKADVAVLHEVAWLNRNDPAAEQVKVLDAWLRNYTN